jgi:hypothetical protein
MPSVYLGISVLPNGKIIMTDSQPTKAAAKQALAEEKRKAGIIKKPKPSK